MFFIIVGPFYTLAPGPGEDAAKDNLFRLARLKPVIYHECIASPQLSRVYVQWPLRLSQCMDDCELLQSGLRIKIPQLEKGPGRRLTRAPSAI